MALRSSARFVLACALTSVVCGCDRPPSDDTATVWTPADHDRVDEKNVASGTQGKAAPKAAPSVNTPVDEGKILGDLAWRTQCVTCHGESGHGDGPSGALVKAPDMAKSDWQAQRTDEAMAASIRNGKGLMPKFDLPDAAVKALVARVRSYKAP
jgi:mono/diheme cytochrome c family protein